MKNKLRIDLNKNTKVTYYLLNIFRLLMPDIFFRRRLKKILKDKENSTYILKRVNYYNKIEKKFSLTSQDTTIENFIKKEKKKTYYFDLLEYLRYFKKNLKISYLFGDITYIPKSPSFVKSRPITGNNQNSILMKLNKVRHFIFVNDTIAFKDKKNILVWRGKCYTKKREDFIQKFYNNQSCNIGQTNTKGDTHVAWQKEKMKLKEQLQYKFILAIEGNDVASNLKWVMSSNSLAFMVKPTYETWFMEGTLLPNYHYVLLKDDYSDLEEKISYYSEHINEALKIINNAHEYIAQFKNQELEQTISLMVLEKYFKNSQQIR
jgi:hypothetical protein